MPPALYRALACLCLFAPAAAAQTFSAQVAPPRFEDQAAQGTTFRNVIEITNVSTKSARFTMKTADWVLGPDGTAVFSDALAPGSCRPWVGIEAPEIQVDPNGKRRYRFEVAVPADAPDGECRFAIMIEGEPVRAQGDLGLPVSGRIGIIVYLAIGKGAAVLSVADTAVQAEQGRDLPVIRVHNSGDAHGRIEGFIEGIDALGKRLTFSPSNSPILPGTTRDIPLYPIPEDETATPLALAFPITMRGRLDWGSQRLDLDARFSK